MNNFTMDFLKMIDAKRFLVSTNGVRYGHPDKEVIARLVGYTDADIVFNYKNVVERLFLEQDYIDYPNLKGRIKIEAYE